MSEQRTCSATTLKYQSLIQSNYVGTVKYSEFNAHEKILKANLRLQTKFVLQMDFTDTDWEVGLSNAGQSLSHDHRKPPKKKVHD